MENNDSPYIYEKPLRSSRTTRSQQIAGLSVAGLLGLVVAFGGTDAANSHSGEKTFKVVSPANSSFDSFLDTTEPVKPPADNH